MAPRAPVSKACPIASGAVPRGDQTMGTLVSFIDEFINGFRRWYSSRRNRLQEVDFEERVFLIPDLLLFLSLLLDPTKWVAFLHYNCYRTTSALNSSERKRVNQPWQEPLNSSPNKTLLLLNCLHQLFFTAMQSGKHTHCPQVWGHCEGLS